MRQKRQEKVKGVEKIKNKMTKKQEETAKSVEKIKIK